MNAKVARPRFVKQDICDAWPAAFKSSFDLVHQRMVLPGIGPRDARSAIANLISCVAPGGWVQLMEIDTRSSAHAFEGPALRDMLEVMESLFKNAGPGADLALQMKRWCEELGLENAQEHEVLLRVGNAHSDPEAGERAASVMGHTVTAVCTGAKGALPAVMNAAPC